MRRRAGDTNSDAENADDWNGDAKKAGDFNDDAKKAGGVENRQKPERERPRIPSAS
ncbi:hypothetical protein Fmac_008499 [Flemingia macrophylla]|uniref:Uncharacterized protein n=1 Tax=Flemingia macrophylla TaxID=520843 RepID=A0ABD1MXN3_9FABA